MRDNLKVLLVDDDADDRMFFSEVINEMDNSINFIYAVDGEACLNLLEKENPLPDYIFLDLNMPKLNGKKCLEFIKAREYCKHIPVIIYSTSKSEEDMAETKKLGAAYFLTKPNAFQDLIDAIKLILSGKPNHGILPKLLHAL